MSEKNDFEGLNYPAPMLIDPVVFMTTFSAMMGLSGLPLMLKTATIMEAWIAIHTSEVGENHSDGIKKLDEIQLLIMELFMHPEKLEERLRLNGRTN